MILMREESQEIEIVLWKYNLLKLITNDQRVPCLDIRLGQSHHVEQVNGGRPKGAAGRTR